MKKLFVAMACFLAVFVVSSAVMSADVWGREDFRAVWVTTVINLDWPSRPGLSAAEMMAEADVFLDRAAEIGLNAVLLQVRPTSDAIYHSSVFPWSDYITGTQGQAPPDGFDPLRYWIDGAHARGMELHAWINPYRVTHGTANNLDVNTLAPNNPARLNPHLVRPHGRGLYFDPGHPQVRQIIIDGIICLITNYNVDGIHFDDYFYPSRDFDDADTFAAFGYGFNDIHEWRRHSVNLLVQGVQEAIRAHRPEVRFGISPFAIWQNNPPNPLGSNTSGQESYHALYSDSKRWVQEGWLDYITPQIYWHMGNAAACFVEVLHWWMGVVEGTGVNLYVGMAPYREVQERSGWAGETLRQLVYSSYFPAVDGHIFFRMEHLMGRVGDDVRYFYANHAARNEWAGVSDDWWTYGHGHYPAYYPDRPIIVADTLTVIQPRRDVNVPGATGYFFFGTSDPNLPLYVNGWPVYDVNRTPEGFFMIHCPLWPGESVFTFTQYGQESVTRTITVTDAPPTSPQPPVVINQLQHGHPYYATITAPTWAFPGPRTTGGSHWMLLPGQMDRVIAYTNNRNWLRLSSGVWVQADDVSTRLAESSTMNVLSNGIYAIESNEIHVMSWMAAAYPAVFAEFSEGVLTLHYGLHSEAPDLDIVRNQSLDGTIFQAVTSGIDENGRPYHAFTIRPEARFEGFWTSFADGVFSINMRLRRQLNPLAPLHGFTFVVDPGHGGTDPGALGALGATWPEAHIVLNVSLMLAENLRSLGAEVVMTRDADTTLTLSDRTETSRAVKPHMFISIHTNSTAETTDATNIRGFTVWYRNEISRPLAQTFLRELHYINPYTTRHFGVHQANHFVSRPSWTPSAILELSFTNNVHDYAWLINPRNQALLADAIAESVVKYFQ